jgi:hypothetical protein
MPVSGIFSPEKMPKNATFPTIGGKPACPLGMLPTEKASMPSAHRWRESCAYVRESCKYVRESRSDLEAARERNGVPLAGGYLQIQH